MEVLKIEPKANKTNTIDIVNTIMLSMGIYLISIILMPFFLFIVPAPSIVLSVRKGMKYGLLSMTIVGVVVYLFTSSILSLVMLLYMLPIVLIMSSMIKQNDSFSKIMSVNIFATIFITIVTLANLQYMLNIDVLSEINSFFTEITKVTNEVLNNSGISEEYIKQTLEGYKLLKQLLPSMGLLSAVALNYGSFSFARSLLRRQNIKLEQSFKFINYRISWKALIPTAAIVGIVYLLYYFKIPYLNIVVYNLVFIYSVIFAAAGIALADYYLTGVVPKFLRIIIPVSVLVFFRGDILYTILAIVDMFVNFRKRYRRIENEKK